MTRVLIVLQIYICEIDYCRDLFHQQTGTFNKYYNWHNESYLLKSKVISRLVLMGLDCISSKR